MPDKDTTTMKIAYFDCFSGASGDMILGALVDAGLDVSELDNMLRDLGLDSFSLKAEKVERKGIATTNLHVKTEENDRHRHLKDILEIINGAEFSDTVKETVHKVFMKIAAAESRIHNKPVEKVHFHEVGALDSIIDIVGTVWGIEKLGIAACYSSALSLGSGSVRCAHGVIPVPAPATLEIVRGFPVIKKEIGSELCTPTGAALVTTLAKYVDRLPPMKILATGYGCGDKIFDEIPNIFRMIIAEKVQSHEQDSVLLVETNIDDMNPELFPYVMDRLLQAGAVDVFLTPVIMKKGRPGNLLSILVNPEQLDTCLDIVFAETTTLGVRIAETYRRKLQRASVTIQTPWGAVRAKEIIRAGKKMYIPEFEECKKIALRENVSIEDVYSAIKRIEYADDQMQ